MQEYQLNSVLDAHEVPGKGDGSLLSSWCAATLITLLVVPAACDPVAERHLPCLIWKTALQGLQAQQGSPAMWRSPSSWD